MRKVQWNDGLGVLEDMAHALSSTSRDMVLKLRVVAETFNFRSKKLLLNFESLCFVAYSV